jgi:tetratricopeptide (TPR) repeat protein
VLFGIDFDHLLLWGHYRLAIDLHERLQGRLSDPLSDANSRNHLGAAYFSVGEIRRAIELFMQALAIAREHTHRSGETAYLGNLGNCFLSLGEIRHAIALYEQALAISREITDRQGEANDLGNLGNCYADLGDIRRSIGLYEEALAISRELDLRQGQEFNLIRLGNRYAELGEIGRSIELYEQAFTIAREIGDRYGESIVLDNRAARDGELGLTEQGISLYEQALAIAREIGDRQLEAMQLGGLGQLRGDLGTWAPAVQCCREGIELADKVGSAQASIGNRVTLATMYLHADDVDAASETAGAATPSDYVRSKAEISLVLGIALSRQGRSDGASQAFGEALKCAEMLLELTNDSWVALDTKALALCGLALVDNNGGVNEATAAFTAARAITSASGIVRRVQRLFDALARCDEAGILQPVRLALTNDGA